MALPVMLLDMVCTAPLYLRMGVDTTLRWAVLRALTLLLVKLGTTCVLGFRFRLEFLKRRHSNLPPPHKRHALPRK